MPNLKTIKTFTFAHEAAVMRAFLEANGYFTLIQNDVNIQVDPLISNALGGVQLLVWESQYDEAYALLLKNGFKLGRKAQSNTLRDWINKWMDSFNLS